jgi:hypothetical protein
MRTESRVVVALAAIVLLASGTAFAGGGFIVNPALLDSVKPGMTAQEVEKILGPEASRSDFPNLGQVSMNYSTRIWSDWYDIGIMLGNDGIVREVQRIKRYGGG